MKRRPITSLLVGGLLAVLLPTAASAQNDAQGSITFLFNSTCNLDQGTPWELPPCEATEDGLGYFLTFEDPARLTGTFDGVQLSDGVTDWVAYGVDRGDWTYAAAQVVFVGTVEGCGAGTVYSEASGEGTATDSSHTYTIVPGGTLPVTGSLDATGTAVVNADGTEALSCTGTYSCDAE